MKKLIKVDEHCIKNGKPKVATGAIYLAVKKIVGENLFGILEELDGSYCILFKDKTKKQILPKNVQEWAKTFDSSKKVTPINFYIEV